MKTAAQALLMAKNETARQKVGFNLLAQAATQQELTADGTITAIEQGVLSF